MLDVAASAPPVPTRRGRRRLLALVGVALLAVAAAGCMPPEERTFFDRTNALRAAQGLATLSEDDALSAKAEQWAQHMAASGVLEHSTMAQGLDGLGWVALGENVGVTTPTSDSLLSLHNMLVASDVHRANLLNSGFTHMGVGLATGPDGRVWVAEVFATL
jgi:uncharacterized protein YkwD